ncbi:MAG: chromosomal replication initiator protein DnaA [Hyphomicrobiaceae bacterium]|nr:chromosomal replication initiator protein DnaA [Hyphomicrobiaceae bacterium]
MTGMGLKGGLANVLERDESGDVDDGAGRPGGRAVSDPRATFERVQRRLRIELGEDLYSSWFSSMMFEDVSGRVAVVSVATPFLRSWIMNNHHDRLRALWQQEIADLISVEVRVRQNAGARPKTVPQARPAEDIVSAAPAPAAAPARPRAGSPLDPALTFDSFVIGASNRFAWRAAREVASGSGTLPFNPLFVHGGVGLGKTHLLQAIGHEARTRGRNVVYLTAERFMTEFAAALSKKTAPAFKEMLRGIDVFLVDDIQFLGGRVLPDEFGHIVNALLDGGRTVVVAADRAPVELDAVDRRITSRLASGLTVEVGVPDYETRLEMVGQRRAGLAPREAAAISDEVLAGVARMIDTNGRDLDGAFNRLLAEVRLGERALDAQSVPELLSYLVRPRDLSKVRVEDIQKVVARYYNLSRQDLLAARRQKNIVLPRQVAMYLAKVLTLRSLPDIGKRFSGRDHTTVLHAVRKIEEHLEKDAQLKHDVECLKRELEQL